MRRIGVYLAAVLVLVTSGCAQKVDVQAETAAIRNADRDWEKATQAKGADGWVSFVVDDAVIYPPTGPILKGRAAIREYMSGVFPAGFAVKWQPDTVEVAGTGDLAYMFGTYELMVNDPEGNPVTSRGKYGNVWKKQPDSSWKAVASVWNSEQPAATATE